VDRCADRWVAFVVPARSGPLCAGGCGSGHTAGHARNNDGPIRPLGDARSNRNAIAFGQQHAYGEHASVAAVRDAHDQPDTALRLVCPGRALPRRRSHVGLAPACSDAHHRLGLLCFRHEPLPPRHFRELAAMPKTQPIANDGKMKRKEYEKELQKLQVELCYLQDWTKAAGARVIVVFEGRDAAGKGGTIKAIAERVSPRVFRVVALPAPSDRQKTQMFIQRYVEHFPAAGEIVIFDRSWYNRAGVERVMGFVSEKEAERFLAICPEIEKYITDAGIILIKFWLEVGPDEQERRFLARINDPLRQWKLSPMDLNSYQHWYDYSRARDMMLKATDTEHAPWHIVRSDDKRRARLNCISRMLELIPYKKTSRPKVKLPKRSTKGRYDDQGSLKGRNFVRGKF
jgi:polyphosphate kinase